MIKIIFYPLLAALTVSSALAQEAVSLSGPDGVVLKAWHYKPLHDKLENGSVVRKPVVVALHGCGGLYSTGGARNGKPNARHHAMGQMLAGQGYHTVFPDSFGSRGVPSICGQAQQPKNGVQIGIEERRADTLAVQTWVRAQPWADAQHIALLGWSHGAMTLLASTDRQNAQIKAAGAPFRAAIAFYPGCVNADKAGYRPNTPLTLLLGADDDWTLPEPCIRMADRLKRAGDDVSLTVYPDAVHDFDTPLPGIRTRSDVPSRRPGAAAGEGVKVGQNPAAREDSWRQVREILKKAFAVD